MKASNTLHRTACTHGRTHKSLSRSLSGNCLVVQPETCASRSVKETPSECRGHILLDAELDPRICAPGEILTIWDVPAAWRTTIHGRRRLTAVPWSKQSRWGQAKAEDGAHEISRSTAPARESQSGLRQEGLPGGRLVRGDAVGSAGAAAPCSRWPAQRVTPFFDALLSHLPRILSLRPVVKLTTCRLRPTNIRKSSLSRWS